MTLNLADAVPYTYTGTQTLVTLYRIDPASGQPVQLPGAMAVVFPSLSAEFNGVAPGVYIAKLTVATNGWANTYFGGSPFRYATIENGTIRVLD